MSNWRNAMFKLICSRGSRYGLLLLALILLGGCSSLSISQTSPAPTTAPQQPTPTPTADTQATFASYVGKWEVHDALLTINADQTGLLIWNAGPCGSAGLCGGNAPIVFTVN